MINARLDANRIKSILLDYYINDLKSNKIIFANEVTFKDGLRKVDLVGITINSLYAYEIKSDYDDLRRLSGQLSDYLNTFDYTTVVTTEKYIQKVKSLLAPSIGIFSVNFNGVKVIRQPRHRRKLIKANLSYFLLRKEIVQELKKANVKISLKLDKETLRLKLISTNSLIQIRNAVYNSLIKRYRQKYNNFLNERYKYTLIEDIKNLTIGDSVLKRF